MQGAEPRIVYRPRPDAAPEAEREALAHVYRFVLDCQAKRREAASEPGKEMPAVPVLGQAGTGAHGRGC